MTKKIFLSLMAVLGLLLSAHAQEREITGSVKDHAGAGIVGATILVEGTTKGTTSGADGSFSIKAAPDNVLVVSFMGYQSHTIKVGTQTRIDMDMIVANNLKVPGAGFGVDTNVVTIITAQGVTELPLQSKDAVAGHIADAIAGK